MSATCSERVNVGGTSTNDGRWTGATRHTCSLALADHAIVEGRRVHSDAQTGHRWTTCDGPKHDGGNVPCWCRRVAA